MTMLDGMRRHKGWLKWSLGLVCLAFVFLYVPEFVNQTAVPGAPTDVLAEVGNYKITVFKFRQVYLQQLQNYRLQTGEEISEDVLRSLGIDRQILQQMIGEYAGLSEAERLGLEVSNAEVRDRILMLPAFQENGQFIGEARYRQLLQFQNPPLTTNQFEEDVRNSIVLERLQAAVTNWIAVTEEEIAEEHRRRNERVQMEIVAFRGDDYRDRVEVTDEDIQLLYSEKSLDYQIPEKRKLRFLLVDEAEIFNSVNPTNEEIEEYYDINLSQYSTPEQVHANHILLRTEGQDEAAVEARATDLAAKARAGADFAEFARQYSQDEGTASQGGDLGLLGRGRMVPEFESAAFALDIDEVSDPVKSQFGFHIIKVVEKQEEVTQSLEEVRETIQNTLKQERASARASALAQGIAAELSTSDDLERAATARGLEVQETGFAALGEPILGLGLATAVTARAFQMEQGEVEGPLPTPTGPVFVTVVDRQEPYIPPLDEIRDDVRENVIRFKALTLAQKRAAEVVATLTEAEDFRTAAEANTLTVVASDLVTRGSQLPEVGFSPAVDAVAFAMPVGSVSTVIETGNMAVVIHLVERTEITAAELEQNRESLHNELRLTRQNQFFSAYMAKVQAQLRIDINLATLEQILAT